MFCCYVAGMTPFCVSNFLGENKKINIMKAKISLAFYACVTYGTMEIKKKPVREKLISKGKFLLVS